jgi:hypothetical protein
VLVVFRYNFKCVWAYFAIFVRESFILADIMIAIKADETVVEAIQDEIII